MKTIVSSALIVLAFFAVSAQEYKGSVAKANTYLYKKDFTKAKGEIDKALTIEKNLGKSKTYMTQGDIYSEISKSTDPSVQALEANAAQVAADAYRKVLEIDGQNSINGLKADENLRNLKQNLIFVGFNDHYKKEDFKGALSIFQNASKAFPSDSTCLHLVAATAQEVEDTDLSLETYLTMIDKDYHDAGIFQNAIYMLRAIKEDDEKALEVVRKGQKAYPDNSTFVQEEISILVKLDKLDDARISLEKALEEDPENVTNIVNLGIIHDNVATSKASEGDQEGAKENFDKAKAYYNRALGVDATNYIANFNLGALYVNQAKTQYDIARDMDITTYMKKGKAYEDKGNEIVKQAIPYLEKAASAKPDQTDALETLKVIFIQLKDNAKVEEIITKIEQVNAGG